MADGAQAGARPAYYAARPGGWRDWWTLLHPPYTAWHLSYVVIGACLAPQVSLAPLLATLVAFFLAVGLAAHALDELNGRPLQTRIPAPTLVAGENDLAQNPFDLRAEHGPSLFDALVQQTGLKLVPQIGPMEMLVVDEATMPGGSGAGR